MILCLLHISRKKEKEKGRTAFLKEAKAGLAAGF